MAGWTGFPRVTLVIGRTCMAHPQPQQVQVSGGAFVLCRAVWTLLLYAQV